MKIFQITSLFAITFFSLLACSPKGELSAEERAKTITNFEECVAAGYKVLRTHPPKCITKDRFIFTKETEQEICKNQCGNGTCEEIVCMGSGCPCAESKDSCPEDCGKVKK